MAYRCSFLDNETYGTDDINRAFSAMTAAGVLPFTQTSTLAAGMNDASALVFETGVGYFGESMRVSKTDATHVFINNGNAVFPSGAMIFIDSDGVTLEITQNAVNYIYLEHNKNLNYIKPCVSLSAPPDGAVKLAEVAEDGTLSDKREFAVSKYRPNSANISKSLKCDLTWNGTAVTGSANMGSAVFGRIIVNSVKSEGSDMNLTGTNCDTISNDSETVFYWRSTTGVSYQFQVKKNGSMLELTLLGGTNKQNTYTVEFEVI
ncbi:MAG: hypothetical protein PUB42_07525 [Firmicutes bacterium]|nr:hypothetical protein [Bacillota bacterium]